MKILFKWINYRNFYSTYSKEILKYSTVDIIESNVNNQVKNYLKERCVLLGFISNSRPSLENKYEEIKLFGDYNMNIDNAVWRPVGSDTHFDEIYVSNEELLILMNRILKYYSLSDTQEYIMLMQNEVKGNNIKKISDVISFFEKIKKNL